MINDAPYLGLDVGLKRTGVSLSESGVSAQPLTTIEWSPPHAHGLIEDILSLVTKHEIKTIVAGLPLYEDGKPTPQSDKTVAILEQLKAVLPEGVKLTSANEYSSTFDGLKKFPGVDKDAAAAAVILQNYLEELGGTWS